MGIKKEDKEMTPFQKLRNMVSEDKTNYIRWLCMTATEKKDQGGFENWSKRMIHNKSIDTVQNWELEESFQKALFYWKGLLHNKRICELYDKMIDAGMKGDVQSARFATELGERLFKNDKENKLEMIASKLNINDESEYDK
ncbi:hypothetical protein RBU49_03075 [Clostridium sp. MB40-C1]|uniref:hypothetical protein n=1 Tax=Clostridium sp. MB40-C1 TaxID=3070996 RepID=UPI0027E1ACA5|nr:hypothetical protein [Clostridium sp. MB40-C1]WMJ81253.1 hypothetical protein RBU49_03075 [Clostridium sp. MB40-C1]